MGNMSYCRFENTVGDLQDCVEALENFDAQEEKGYQNLSDREKRKADEMRELCEEYLRVYDENVLDQ